MIDKKKETFETNINIILLKSYLNRTFMIY